MEKKICAYIFAVTFVALSTVVHGQPSTINREPSVEPIVEVDIVSGNPKEGSAGYNFAEAGPVTKSRVPANIVTKTKERSSTSMAGPIIFLIALPIGLWIIVSKKFSKKSEERTVDYYPKTQQFKPFKTDYQKPSEDEDDIDYPKAS